MKSLAQNLLSFIHEIYLNEKRSHSEQNTIKNDLSVLNSYYQIERNSDSEISRYYFSFQDIGKVGVNPQAKYSTPAGVYAYPLKYMFKKFTIGRIPYAMNRPELFLLELTSDKILFANNYSNFDDEIDKLKDYCNNNNIDFSNAVKEAEEYIRYCNGGRLDKEKVNPYTISHYIAKTAKGGLSLINLWNKILHNVLGYDAIIDNGTGLIHDNEPTQACFLVSSSYKVVEKLKNNISNYVNGLDFSSGKERFEKVKFERLTIENPCEEDPYLVNQSAILTFPKSLKVNDSLTLEVDFPERNRIYISRFPNDLYVKGSLILCNLTNLRKLPDNLYVGGRLSLVGTDVTKLPENAQIKKAIRIDKSKITEIPDSWNVINGLELREVTINKFPRNLTINGNFTISRCNLNINSLPDNLTVDGNVYIDFEYKDIFKEKYPNLKIR